MYRLKTAVLLVNRGNKSIELNPEIADVDGVFCRCEGTLRMLKKEFLAAARKLIQVTMISGWKRRTKNEPRLTVP